MQWQFVRSVGFAEAVLGLLVMYPACSFARPRHSHTVLLFNYAQGKGDSDPVPAVHAVELPFRFSEGSQAWDFTKCLSTSITSCSVGIDMCFGKDPTATLSGSLRANNAGAQNCLRNVKPWRVPSGTSGPCFQLIVRKLPAAHLGRRVGV